MRSSSLHHNPLTVWRVENAAGEGPYDSGASSGVGPRGSAPVVDFGVRHEDKDAWWVRHEGWRFGFAHKEDAVAWFGEARLKKLAEKGYRLVKKEAAIIEPSKSGMQVFYLPVEKKLSGKEQVLALGRQVEAGATVEGWDQRAQRSMSMWAMASVCRDDPGSWPYDKGLLARYLRELKQYQQPGESARDAWDRYAKQVKFRKQRRNPVEQYDDDDDDDYDDPLYGAKENPAADWLWSKTKARCLKRGDVMQLMVHGEEEPSAWVVKTARHGSWARERMVQVALKRFGDPRAKIQEFKERWYLNDEVIVSYRLGLDCDENPEARRASR